MKVLFFLLSVLSAGLIIKYFYVDISAPETKNFDYSYMDSLFGSSFRDSTELNRNFSLKGIDSKSELLDFRGNIIKNLKPESININTASADELIKLPGIGNIVAFRIIEYRKKRLFLKKEDIKNVSGIGDKKFTDIEKYISVE